MLVSGEKTLSKQKWTTWTSTNKDLKKFSKKLKATTTTTTTTTSTTTPKLIFEENLIAQLISIPVINKFPFLMNEIRTKVNLKNYFKNNKYIYNKKSNKLCLRYTPRDPRLRFNKHSNELSELIGGDISSDYKNSKFCENYICERFLD